MKTILKYICIFIFTLTILITILPMVSAIPTKYVENNIRNSLKYFKENLIEVKFTRMNREYSYLHPYADSILMNIIWNTDTNKPLNSILEAKYYNSNLEMSTGAEDLIKTVEEGKERKEEKQEYIRYWHGTIIFLKPLLMLFNIEQIYIFNAILLSILTIILLVILWQRKVKILVVSFIIGLFMIAIWYVPFCIEYTTTFIIMLITSIISVKIENKGDKYLKYLFFITGIVTYFFDFLTTETITILVPLILVLTIRYKEKRLTNFKQAILFIISSCGLWFIGYVATFLAKGIIASIILKINAFDYIIDKAIYRINGADSIISFETMKEQVIFRNFHTLYPINIIKNKQKLLALFILLVLAYLIFFDMKNIKKMWFPLTMILIGIIPYIRYLILVNHSYRHYFFTFRSQLSTIMAIIIIIVNTIDRNKLTKEINLKNDNTM